MEPPSGEDPPDLAAVAPDAAAGDADEEFALHPNVPRRGPLLLAFGAVTFCGVLGALIGYGLVNASCQENPSLLEQLLESVHGYHPAAHSCDAARAGGSIIGAVLAALGAAVVAVLMLRAMAEWRTHRPDPGPPSAV